MLQDTKIYGILKEKCPKCHEGRIFVYPNPYNLKRTAQMHPRCPKCGLNYAPEPGFYFGAAYVAYGMSVAVSAAVVLSLFPFWGWNNILSYLIIISALLILLSPIIFRQSRVIWLSMFTKYDKNAALNFEKKMAQKSVMD